MNTTLKLLACILAINIVMSILAADDQSNISTNSWEQHPEGVSLATFLITSMENGVQKNSIKVYVKNTSTAKKYLPADYNDRAIQIFYVTNDGKHIPLRDYTLKAPPVFTMPAMPNSRPYQPEEVGVRTIELSASELAIVKEYPVLCRFYVSNQEVGGYTPIESTPRMLTGGP